MATRWTALESFQPGSSTGATAACLATRAPRAARPHGPRAIWATAFFGGLRLGELQALLIEDIQGDTIRVRASWDPKAGRLDTKSRAGRRVVPIIGRLRDELALDAEQRSWTSGYVFGRSPQQPFAPSTVYVQARKAWERGELDAITLHECRHTFASFMIAAGANPKALCSIMGHSSITETFDRYGHLFPGDESEAGALLTRYLDT